MKKKKDSTLNPEPQIPVEKPKSLERTRDQISKRSYEYCSGDDKFIFKENITYVDFTGGSALRHMYFPGHTEIEQSVKIKRPTGTIILSKNDIGALRNVFKVIDAE